MVNRTNISQFEQCRFVGETNRFQEQRCDQPGHIHRQRNDVLLVRQDLAQIFLEFGFQLQQI
jgi:hypothetical protein